LKKKLKVGNEKRACSPDYRSAHLKMGKRILLTSCRDWVLCVGSSVCLSLWHVTRREQNHQRLRLARNQMNGSRLRKQAGTKGNRILHKAWPSCSPYSIC